MLIIAIDTSGKSAGVSLAEGDAQSFRAIESSAISGGTFSAQLVPTVAELLRKHGFAAKDLGGFAVVSGPGSFTGLRIGLSAIKGLAEVLQKPIATVSLLEAVASLPNVASSLNLTSSSMSHNNVASVLDASRGEFFLGLYAFAGDGTGKMQHEALCSQAELLDEIQSDTQPAVITCDESVARVLSTLHIPHEVAARPDSALIAQLGLRKLLTGQTTPVESLDANYLRRSDAEVLLLKGSHK